MGGRGVSVKALKLRSATQHPLRPYTNMPAGKEVMIVIMRRLVESSRHVVLCLVQTGVIGVISSEGSLVNTDTQCFGKQDMNVSQGIQCKPNAQQVQKKKKAMVKQETSVCPEI